jgi:hypothetical protein
MLTGRRIRERQAAEKAGLPPSPPPRPAEISRREHDAEIAALKKAHAAEVAELRQRLAHEGKGETTAEVQALIEQARGDFEKWAEEVWAQVRDAQEQLAKLEAENADLRAQLEQATTAQASAPGSQPLDDATTSDANDAGAPTPEAAGAAPAEPATPAAPTPEGSTPEPAAPKRTKRST